MERDDDQAPALGQQAHRLRETLRQGVKLSINCYPQCLERLRCRMDAPLPALGPGNHRCQATGSLNWPRRDNRASNPSGLTFFAILEQQIGQIRLGQPIDQIGRGLRLSGIKAHIEWSIGLKGEASAFVG
jgi:hypothetical protein